MSRNKELNQKIKDERKEQILSNALILFATRGLSATKITDISSASGISQGLIYHYYKSKEEIFIELIKYAFQRMNIACMELEKLSLPPREKLIMAIENLVHGLDSNEATSYYHLIILQANVSEAIPGDAKEIINKESSLPYEVIERIFIEGQKDGSVKDFDARDLAVVFWTTIKGLAFNKAAYGNDFKTPDINILLNMFLKQ
ncbi:MAG TPA: TetR/AcrR family transcriptional regulator [Clostridia bacterium]